MNHFFYSYNFSKDYFHRVIKTWHCLVKGYVLTIQFLTEWLHILVMIRKKENFQASDHS